jgi:hypothetical protein
MEAETDTRCYPTLFTLSTQNLHTGYFAARMGQKKLAQTHASVEWMG